MELVLFDLDNTLLAGDSDYEWGQFLIEAGAVERASYEGRNEAFYVQYLAGTLDIHEFLRFALKPLARHSRAELDAWHRDFMARKILPMITDAARALVARHLERGSLVAIVTATNAFVTAPIAREFGVAHLIATDPEEAAGRFTGRVRGTPCFQHGKVVRVSEWLAALGHGWQDFESSWCYSDSANDLPLLERVTHPVTVNPDPRLAHIAAARGWDVLTLA